MVTRVIRSEADIEWLSRLIKSRKLPITVEILAGENRTSAQNRLQRQWCNDVSQQLADRTAEEVRAYSKLHFGVPILRAESETFCAAYDEIIRPLSYEAKLRLMSVPFDFAVTRNMTVKQLTAYLDAMSAHWSAQGVQLTDPQDLRFAA